MKTKLPVVILAVLLAASIGIAFMLNSQQADTISSLEAKEKDFENEIASLQDELSVLNTDITEKDLLVTDLNNQVDTLNENVTTLENQSVDLEAKLDQSQSALDYEKSLKHKWATYIKPEEIMGEWTVIQLLDEEEDFDVNAPVEDRWLKSVKFNSSTVMFDMGQGYSGGISWIDDHIMSSDAAMGFRIETIEGQDYMFLEWKSGDYLRDSSMDYYVLKK